MHIGNYGMRPIREEDLQLLLQWRNSERIHSMMLTDHRITWDEHIKWFKKIKQYIPKRHFVLEYKKHSIGYIGYDYNSKDRSCSPGSYLGVSAGLPIDAALAMVFIVAKYAFDYFDIDCVKSVVLKKNTGVLKMNQLIGYEIRDDKVERYKGENKEETVLIYLSRKHWQDKCLGQEKIFGRC